MPAAPAAPRADARPDAAVPAREPLRALSLLRAWRGARSPEDPFDVVVTTRRILPAALWRETATDQPAAAGRRAVKASRRWFQAHDRQTSTS